MFPQLLILKFFRKSFSKRFLVKVSFRSTRFSRLVPKKGPTFVAKYAVRGNPPLVRLFDKCHLDFISKAGLFHDEHVPGCRNYNHFTMKMREYECRNYNANEYGPLLPHRTELRRKIDVPLNSRIQSCPSQLSQFPNFNFNNYYFGSSIVRFRLLDEVAELHKRAQPPLD
jgi:hypothetical protein